MQLFLPVVCLTTCIDSYSENNIVLQIISIEPIVFIINEFVFNTMYYLKNEQECFIRFKATSAQREWL